MDGALSASSLTQRAKFNIDLEYLGIFLAETLITRIDAFMAPDRITILKACHNRLAAEGGDIVEHLLASQIQRLLSTAITPDVLQEQIAHTASVL
jgi:hypothetical protein